MLLTQGRDMPKEFVLQEEDDKNMSLEEEVCEEDDKSLSLGMPMQPDHHHFSA